jgi:hypothetical protein
LSFDEQRKISLSLPADSYILRIKSTGDLNIDISPKGMNLLKGNLFLRECDASVITTNTNVNVTHTPLILPGHIYKEIIKEKKFTGNISRQKRHTYLYLKNIHKQSDSKIFSYLFYTITDKSIELRGYDKSIWNQIKSISEEKYLREIVVCGYYIVDNGCPYIEVHSIADLEPFIKGLEQQSILKHTQSNILK